jgi:hypothetical protein
MAARLKSNFAARKVIGWVWSALRPHRQGLLLAGLVAYLLLRGIIPAFTIDIWPPRRVAFQLLVGLDSPKRFASAPRRFVMKVGR